MKEFSHHYDQVGVVQVGEEGNQAVVQSSADLVEQIEMVGEM